MANMQLTKTPMAEQDPQVRNQNFLEVALGYTLEEAMNEAKHPLQEPGLRVWLPGGHPHPGIFGSGSPGEHRCRL